MYLAHGTTPHVARKIAPKVGLRTRSHHRRSNWKGNPSHPSCVYLTNAYAFHYGKMASPGTDLGLVEVNADRLAYGSLMADEDALEQASRESMIDIPGGESLQTRTRYFREQLRNYAARGYAATWSLDAIGNCTHWGSIHPGAISRCVVIHNYHLPSFTAAFDPTITIVNFMIMGERYVEMQKLFLGREFNMEKLFLPGQKDARRERALEEFAAIVESNREIVYDGEEKAA